MKKSTLFFLFLCVTFCEFAGGNIDIPEPADLALVEETLLLTAIEKAQQAVRSSPEDADAWGTLGHVYLSHGWEEAAIPCYRQASLLDPGEFKWLYLLGRLQQQREPEGAVEHLTRAIRLKSEYAPAHLYLAAALRILGRFDEAQQHLRRAKLLQPNNPFSELWLGEIALASGELEQARTHLEEAVDLNPGQSEAHVLLAQIATALGDTEAAKRHAHAARRVSRYSELADPLWWDVLKAGVTAPLYAERGRRYLSEGDYASAVAEFEVLISSRQKDVEIWLDYGIALLHVDRYNEAFAALESAQALLRLDSEREPDESLYLKAQIYYYIGQLYYETGHPEASIQTCQKAIRLGEAGLRKGTPDLREHVLFSNIHANLAMIYEDLNRLDEAVAAYREALELLPTKPSLHRDLAGVYWKQKRYTEAEPHYKAVVEHDDADIQARYRLGLIFLTQGRYRKAISAFERVIELDNKHVRGYGGLGLACQKAGDIPGAVQAFERVLVLEPGNPNALQMLEKLHKSR